MVLADSGTTIQVRMGVRFLGRDQRLAEESTRNSRLCRRQSENRKKFCDKGMVPQDSGHFGQLGITRTIKEPQEDISSSCSLDGSLCGPHAGFKRDMQPQSF